VKYGFQIPVASYTKKQAVAGDVLFVAAAAAAAQGSAEFIVQSKR
jgi:hypothetical protein